jgi:hypothetical protein
MSDPPPGAVLMTNSTGLVGATAADDAPGLPLGAAAGLAQAVKKVATAQIATVERLICLAPPKAGTPAGV